MCLYVIQPYICEAFFFEHKGTESLQDCQINKKKKGKGRELCCVIKENAFFKLNNKKKNVKERKKNESCSMIIGSFPIKSRDSFYLHRK